jgi:lipoate-protein ligase B
VLKHQSEQTGFGILVSMERMCRVHRLGRVDYQEAWQLQLKWATEIASGARPPSLLLLEHSHTYTFGRAGHPENLLWNQAELERRGVAVYWVDRGGDVTYHGPGQLVGYPLLPLKTLEGVNAAADFDPAQCVDAVGYLRRLEKMLLRALDFLSLPATGILACRLPGLTGVWVVPGTGEAHPAKLAAIGAKVDANGITRHGFALNVNPDMRYWQGIVGCGLREYAAISLAELLAAPPPMDQVEAAVIQAFGECFGYTLEIV